MCPLLHVDALHRFRRFRVPAGFGASRPDPGAHRFLGFLAASCEVDVVVVVQFGHDGVALAEAAQQDLLGERVLDEALDGAADAKRA